MSYLGSSTMANQQVSYYALEGAGNQGPPGPPGPQGEPGANGLSVLSDVVPPAAGVGVVGDMYIDLATTQLYKKTDAATWTPEFALQGEPGAPGTAATIVVGATSTGAPGSQASVINTGTPNAAVLRFTIPQGIQGPPGSAANAATWASFSASQAVDMSGNDISNAGSISSTALTSNNISVQNLDGIVQLGQIDKPLQDFSVDAQDVAIHHQSAAFPMLISSDGTMQIESAGNLSLASTGGEILVSDGNLNLNGYDLNNVGSLSTSGAGNSAVFGSYVPPSAPLALFSAIASELSLQHLNPLTELSVKATGDARIEATGGDLNLIGDDVNIATTGSTNVLNITSLAGIQNTAGGFFNVTAGGGMGIQAGGLISITTPGQINIGSSNTLGASTSIEKLDIIDSVVSKVDGAADLQFENVKKISNAGDGTNTLTLEATNAALTLQGTQTNVTSLANGNVVIAPQGTGTTRIGTGTTADVLVVDATGLATFTVPPQCAAVPVTPAALVNKTYADTKLPANADVEVAHNFAATAVDSTTTGPFLYVPSAPTAPTGTPTEIAGAVPLFVQTGGTAKLWAYFAGTWVPV